MPELDPKRVREQRMRYVVLNAVYDAADRYPCVRIDSHHLLEDLGLGQDELKRLVSYLTQCGFLAAGVEEMSEPATRKSLVCITQRGIDYIQSDARRRRTVRDDPGLDHG